MPTPYEYARMSQESYNPLMIPPDGWEVLSVSSADLDKNNGYQGVVFINHRTHEIVIAHVGTDDLADIGDNTDISTGNIPEQFWASQYFGMCQGP